MEDIGIIHAAQYLHGLEKSLQNALIDVLDGGSMLQVWKCEQERVRQYPKYYIAAYNRWVRTYLRYSKPDMVESNDAKITLKFMLYEIRKLLSASALAKRRLWNRRKYKDNQEI